MCNKLHSAAKSVADGEYQQAYDKLQSLLAKLDDQPSPGDWMVHVQPEDGKAVVHDTLAQLAFLISLEL
jgi:hypothetical protein